MFLAKKNTKNNVNSALYRTLPFLCRQRAGYMRNQMTNVLKCAGGYVGSANLETFREKKILEKVTEKNYRRLQQPLVVGGLTSIFFQD